VTDDEQPTERSMRELFLEIARVRGYVQDGSRHDAVRCLRLMAATVGDVPADVVLRLNDACERVGSAVVAQRTLAMVINIGSRGQYADATAFYER
jgi:hypothetical protein